MTLTESRFQQPWAGGTPLLAYSAAPLKRSGAGERRLGSAKLTMLTKH
jgi:hypothetical protein